MHFILSVCAGSKKKELRGEREAGSAKSVKRAACQTCTAGGEALVTMVTEGKPGACSMFMNQFPPGLFVDCYCKDQLSQIAYGAHPVGVYSSCAESSAHHLHTWHGQGRC